MDLQSAGHRGVALLLSLPSTRLFLAEDSLTAHLTLWSAHERQLTVAGSSNTPFPYTIPYWHISSDEDFAVRWKRGRKCTDDGYKNIIKKRSTSSQLMETSISFGEALGRAGLSIRSLIYDLLSFAYVFTGFCKLLSIRAAGVMGMFCRGKVKAWHVYFCLCSWGAGDSLIKSRFLWSPSSK